MDGNSLDRRSRTRLQQEYADRLRDAVSASLGGKTSTPQDLKARLDEIENYSRLLSLTQSAWNRDSLVAILVAASCIAFPAFLWSKKVSRTNISLTTQTESIRGDIVEPWHLNRPFQSKSMHLERLTAAVSPNIGLAMHDTDGDVWLRLDGGQITLQSMELDQGTMFQITSENNRLSLFVNRQPFRGTITLTGKGTMSAGTKVGQTSLSRSYDLPVPEMVEFAVADPRGVPTELTIHDPERWSLIGIPLSNVSFQLETVRALGENETISGIKSGSLKFNDTSWSPIELSEGELLAVHETQKARIDSRGEGGLIRLSLNGFVKNVTLGDSDLKQELAPSYLEYFYNQKSFTFFWGAIVVIWGLLWGIRKTIFR